MFDALKPRTMLCDLSLLLGLFFKNEVKRRHDFEISVIVSFYQIRHRIPPEHNVFLKII